MTCTDLTVKMHGKVSVWPKSQVVIPKDVRDLLNIKPGDDLMIISKWDMAIGMIKSDDVQKFLEYVKAEMKE
jgi:AbrB family looped-hinge helix DNA binding protein